MNTNTVKKEEEKEENKYSNVVHLSFLQPEGKYSWKGSRKVVDPKWILLNTCYISLGYSIVLHRPV